ncbi:MAG: hypothetical protein R2685_02535 [Candidatus Nitrosocosmicus sp.]|nr:hypothetical protein [Candidatus Nitrosocosmicus sp.]
MQASNLILDFNSIILQVNSIELFVSVIMGLILGISFILGATIALRSKITSLLKANIIAFAAGIFFSTVSFSLIGESVKEAGVLFMIIGLALGSIIFSEIYHFLNKPKDELWPRHFPKKLFNKDQQQNAENRGEESIFTTSSSAPDKVSNGNKKDDDSGNKSRIIIIGTLLDSIPEGLFLGILIAIEHSAIIGALLALFLGNLATAIEGAERMIEQKIVFRKIILRWLMVSLIVTATIPLGYFLVRSLTNEQISIILGFAAGALLAFITEELIPAAFKKTKYHIGLATTFGFVIGYLLFHFL